MGPVISDQRKNINEYLWMNLLIAFLQIIVMVIGMKFPKHPKKIFSKFYSFIRLKFLQKQ